MDNSLTSDLPSESFQHKWVKNTSIGNSKIVFGSTMRPARVIPYKPMQFYTNSQYMNYRDEQVPQEQEDDLERIAREFQGAKSIQPSSLFGDVSNQKTSVPGHRGGFETIIMGDTTIDTCIQGKFIRNKTPSDLRPQSRETYAKKPHSPEYYSHLMTENQKVIS